MTGRDEQSEQILARMLRTDDETPALADLRTGTANEVATVCGPALTLRLALLVMIAARLDLSEIDRVRLSVTAERFGSTGSRL